MSSLGKLTIAITANTKGLESAAKKTKSLLGSIGRAATSLPGLLGIAGGTAAAAGLIKTADAYTTMGAQLEYLTGTAAGAEDAQAGLYDMSQRTRTSMTDNATALIRLGNAQELMGTTTEENIDILGGLNTLFLKTGVSSTGAGSAMLQLVQALGSGKLAGDEFKSIFENAPALVKVFADAMGVGIGEMKGLASEGKVTTEIMTDALKVLGDEAAYSMDELPDTFSAAWQSVVNTFQDVWDEINDETGIMSWINDAIEGLGTWLSDNKSMFVDWFNEMKDSLTDGRIEVAVENLKATLADLWNDIILNSGTMEQFFEKSIRGMELMIGTAEALIKVLDWFVERWDNFMSTSAQFDDFMEAGREKLVFKGGEAAQRTAGEILTEGGNTVINNFNTKVNKTDVREIGQMGATAGARL